jgi:PAS domain S-box-containing protein
MVMVSVLDNPERAKEALELGVYGYIVKPFTRNIVLINVENALRRSRLEGEKRAYLDKLATLVRQRTETLENQLTFLQDLINAIPSPIFYKDRQNKFKGCNQAFEKMTGLSRESIIGKRAVDILPEDLATISKETDHQLLLAPGMITYEYDLIYPDQTPHNMLVNKATYHDAGGGVAGQVGVMVDITEKISMERNLRQAQKLESIGQLAAGIAHEINTPTQYIGDNTRFVQEATTDLLAVLTAYAGLLAAAKTGAPLDDHITAVEQEIESADLDYLQKEIPQAIEQTLEGVSRVSKIVTSMRQFSHPGTGKKTPVDLNKALEATITVARNEWKYIADLETDFDSRLPLVNCLPGEINQVFLNLLINAAHAVGEVSDDGRKGKGTIRIATQLDDGWATVSISDTGSGIPESIHQRIFDPFFTTKTVGKGTGQGLAIAHRVITEKHAGSISFETGQDQGTTFTIKLPLGAPEEKESIESEAINEDHDR